MTSTEQQKPSIRTLGNTTCIAQGLLVGNIQKLIQSTLGFATMGKAANLGLATRNAVTDLF